METHKFKKRSLGKRCHPTLLGEERFVCFIAATVPVHQFQHCLKQPGSFVSASIYLGARNHTNCFNKKNMKNCSLSSQVTRMAKRECFGGESPQTAAPAPGMGRVDLIFHVWRLTCSSPFCLTPGQLMSKPWRPLSAQEGKLMQTLGFCVVTFTSNYYKNENHSLIFSVKANRLGCLSSLFCT